MNDDGRPSLAARLPTDDDLLDADLHELMGIARERAVVDVGIDVVARPDVDVDATRRVLAAAQAAARLIARHGDDAELTDAERQAVELFILLTSRPALFVVDGVVRDRPPNWPQIQRDDELITSRVAGVGRIEAAPGGRINASGTRFLVGERVILTNNHVLAGLFRAASLSWWETRPDWFAEHIARANRSWPDGGGPLFELIGELGSSHSRRTVVTRILGHHLTVDVAVLEIADMPPGAMTLRLATCEPDDFTARSLYAVGYPVRDTVTPEPVARRIFGGGEARATKRCSPGNVMVWRDAHEFTHDASTLPGSSGSALVDFELDEVVGIHFAGRFETHNRAVPLWKVRDDPVLVDNGVVFGG